MNPFWDEPFVVDPGIKPLIVLTTISSLGVSIFESPEIVANIGAHRPAAVKVLFRLIQIPDRCKSPVTSLVNASLLLESTVGRLSLSRHAAR